MINADAMYAALKQDRTLRLWYVVLWLPYQVWRLWRRVRGAG